MSLSEALKSLLLHWAYIQKKHLTFSVANENTALHSHHIGLWKPQLILKYFCTVGRIHHTNLAFFSFWFQTHFLPHLSHYKLKHLSSILKGLRGYGGTTKGFDPFKNYPVWQQLRWVFGLVKVETLQLVLKFLVADISLKISAGLLLPFQVSAAHCLGHIAQTSYHGLLWQMHITLPCTSTGPPHRGGHSTSEPGFVICECWVFDILAIRVAPHPEQCPVSP